MNKVFKKMFEYNMITDGTRQAVENMRFHDWCRPFKSKEILAITLIFGALVAMLARTNQYLSGIVAYEKLKLGTTTGEPYAETTEESTSRNRFALKAGAVAATLFATFFFPIAAVCDYRAQGH